MHPEGTYLTIAEKGTSPDIRILSWPSLEVAQILEGGTERAFTDVAFSSDGNTLASVGGCVCVFGAVRVGFLFPHNAYAMALLGVLMSAF